jgi:hypothetical protein
VTGKTDPIDSKKNTTPTVARAVVKAIVRAIERKEAVGQTFIVNNDLETIPWEDYVRKHSEMFGVSIGTRY